MKLRFVIPFALLSACAGQPPIQSSPSVQVVSASELPPPARTDLFANERPYLIGPFDKLRIDVFGLPELTNRTVQVDASGRISFPLAGVVEVSGKAPIEVADALAVALRSAHVRDPQVTVNLEETVSQVVTIDGEVREPGLFPVVGHMTLMRAVARARGLGEFADQKDVVVFRTVNGQRMAALYNLRAIRRGVYADPEIFANDVVVVGDSQARRLFRDVTAAASLLTTPLIIALQ
jgi:polysaccharide export outer membrane protein